MPCEKCGDNPKSLVIHEKSLWCWPCHNETKGVPFGVAPGVIGDDIPGGLVIRHMASEPIKFYSKSAIRKAAYDRNLTILGETPKPNPRIMEAERVKREIRSKKLD
jgi:hypothetical protein